MAKRKAKTKRAKTPAKPRAASKPKAKPPAPKEKSPLQKAVTEAGFIIGQLKAHLKNTQITFLKIGALLVDVRDRKRYEVLHHKDIEEFAWVRLRMKRSKLYSYMQCYEWVKANHPEWLASPVKGAIPDLTDIGDLILIEKELANKDLDPGKKKGLEKLQEKALAGDLAAGELAAFRQRTRRSSDESGKAYLSALRALRRRGAQIPNVVPTKVLDHLDAAIALMAAPKVDVAAAQRALIWLSQASISENLSQNA
jgi:hypothetical protein